MAKLELKIRAESVQVFQRAGPRAPEGEVWISFGAYQASRPTGEAFIRQRGASAVHVISTAGDWYQHSEMTEVIAGIRGLLDSLGQRRIVLGGSMGGFAALLFAGALEADLVIAGTPQTLVDHTNGRDQRWTREWRKLAETEGLARPDVRGHVDPGIPTKIVLDRFIREDLWHLNHLGSGPNIDVFNFPTAGHETFRALQSLGLWRELMTAFADEDADEIVRVQQLFKRRRKGSFDYHYTIAHRLLDAGRFDAALEMFRRSLRFRDDLAEPYFHMSVALEASGRLNRAISAVSESLRLGNTIGARERLGLLLRKGGDWQGAEAVYREGLEIDPSAAPLRAAWAELLLERAGQDLAQAVAHLGPGEDLDSIFERLRTRARQIAAGVDSGGATEVANS